MLNKHLIKEIKPYKKKFVLLFMLSITNAVCTISIAYALMKIINGVFLADMNLKEAAPFFAMLLFLMFAKAFVRWQNQLTAHDISLSIQQKLRNRLLNHIVTAGPGEMSQEKTGGLVTLFTNGIEGLDDYFTKFLPQVITVGIIPPLILVAVLPMDWISALLFCLTAPLIPLFMMLIGRLAGNANAKQWKTLSTLSIHFLELLEGLTTLKIFNQSINQIKEVTRLSNDFRDATLKVLRLAFLSSFVLELISTLSIALIAIGIGLRLLQGNLAFETAFLVLLLAPEFYQPLRQSGAAFHAAMTATTAADQIYRILKKPLNIPHTNLQRIEKTTVPFSIQFEDISFRYQQEREIALRGLTFLIEAGKHIAIVGGSGAGKSTIFQLLLQLVQPQKGEIKINDLSLCSIDPVYWRSRIAYVPQMPHIFSASVFDNIVLGNTVADENDVIAAAKAAAIHEFILTLPETYQTKLGDGGQPLSGGQMRRIAIARAFLQDAPLILLDEMTTGLDTKTEKIIAQSVADLTYKKTVLTIAHRLDSVKNADKILVIEKGRLVEIGTHAELLQKGGRYFTMTAADRRNL
ncbi:thiol reductant ABC exporter subunit CydD [Propionispira raffinosivorans]|uniref:thiol reductant ABC exporter subunit CydD n=1 Tax=Propionispira raffinosivorans TaxID=86959 RepID=UPI00036451F5|nr:thiol reductant ABC exporter subunit CydD [Propionispira raffinosivorans]